MSHRYERDEVDSLGVEKYRDNTIAQIATTKHYATYIVATSQGKGRGIASRRRKSHKDNSSCASGGVRGSRISRKQHTGTC